jgi:hypothetical protein
MILLLAFAAHGVTVTGILMAIAALTLGALGTLITAPQPQPLIPAASPDQDTIVAQAENLRTQFEVLTGTTDVIQGGGGNLLSLPAVTNSNGGAPVTPVSGKSFINTAGVDACTLATPVPGLPSAGGNDGLTIEIADVGGHAHTVTTAANKINGNKHIATFPGTVGARIQLTAWNGIWYTDGGGTTLS